MNENIHSRIYTYIYAGIATAALSFIKPNKLNNIKMSISD